MLSAVGRGLIGLLILLVALPLTLPSLAGHATLAGERGHCAGPDGVVQSLNGHAPRQYAGEYCAIDAVIAPPYTVQPYFQEPELSTHQEAGLTVLENPTYSWHTGPATLYAGSPLAANATQAITPFLYLLLIIAAFVVILRPR